MSTMEKMQVLSDMAQYDLCDKVSDFKNNMTYATRSAISRSLK